MEKTKDCKGDGTRILNKQKTLSFRGVFDEESSVANQKTIVIPCRDTESML
jgi:hypothetical protein